MTKKDYQASKGIIKTFEVIIKFCPRISEDFEYFTHQTIARALRKWFDLRGKELTVKEHR